MTADDLRKQYALVYKALTRERKMREEVLKPGFYQQRKLEEIDRALEALAAIKDFAKLHTEEPPEQVVLIDEPTRGGY